VFPPSARKKPFLLGRIAELSKTVEFRPTVTAIPKSKDFSVGLCAFLIYGCRSKPTPICLLGTPEPPPPPRGGGPPIVQIQASRFFFAKSELNPPGIFKRTSALRDAITPNRFGKIFEIMHILGFLWLAKHILLKDLQQI